MTQRGAPLLRAPLTFLTPALRSTRQHYASKTLLSSSSSRSASNTTAPPAPTAPHSNREISDSLSGIIPSRRSVRGNRSSHPTSTATSNPGLGDVKTKSERESELIAKAIGFDPKRANYGIGGAFAGSLASARSRGDPPPPPVRLDAYVGRSVLVDGRNGLMSAIRQMEMGVRRNGVKIQHASQRFHERAGLKRKRLRSVRWRKRFKLGFQATVAKVEKMRRMGW